MGLSQFFSGGKSTSDNQAKQLLALLITDTTIQAGFWQIGEGRIVLLEKSTVLSYSDAASLSVETDKALQELGKASEDVDEVILGLEFNWVGQEGIADLKKPILKQLVQELALKPVGFVVSTEALFHFLTTQDPQLSTLLIQYSTDHITVSVVNRGKLASTERVGRSENAGADIQEATARLLTHEEQAILPPRIHLVSAMLSARELKEQKQELAAFDWKAINPKIVHQPIVEVLPPETLLEAVIQEGGKAVAEAQGFQVKGAMEKKVSAGPSESKAFGSDISDDQANVHPERQLFSNDFTVPTDLDGGISMVGPAAHGKDRKGLEGSKNSEEFLNDTSIKKTRFPALPAMPAFATPSLAAPNFKAPALDWMSHHLTFVFGGFGAGLLALVIIGWMWLANAKQAMVNLTLNAKTVTGEVTITLDPNAAASSPENLVLKAALVTETLTETKQKNTTGVTLVGDKAKGKVTVINKTNEEKTIPAGTQLAAGSLTFTLDEEVKVASASVSRNNESETRTYGKSEVAATAVKLGAESNIPTQRAMSVGTFADSSVAAESAVAFTGGSSREVRVFSKEDEVALLAEVTKQVADAAAERFKQQSSSGVHLEPTGSVRVIKTNYNAKVGDEVSSVSLTLEAEVAAVSYQNEDVNSLVKVALANQVPEGHTLSDKDPSILSQPTEGTASPSAATSQSSRVVLKTNISAQALPNFNQDEFKTEIAGQSVSSAEAILRGKTQVKEVSIELLPAIARSLSNSLPKNMQQITFTIVN